MSRFSQLVKHVEQLNPQLAADIAREYDAVSGRRAFGLNFERHAPETVELPGRPVRVGDKVRFIPARGAAASTVDGRVWRVTRINRSGAQPVAQLVLHVADDADEMVELETAQRAVEDLVVIAEFRDPIYPGLVSTGKVERGGGKPFHTVINAENFHALQTLLYTHEGKVDAIYIDPPYNTGARDWKYNNDYVDGEDIYRHSKWLAFMERRLKLAKRLLNPLDSVLIVTIDEKEYLRLGLLLSQVFPEADIQMVSDVINRAGSPRAGRFSRVDEYIYYVFIGEAAVTPWTSTMLGEDEATTPMPTVWFTAVRRGSGSAREDKKSGKASFYPVVIDAETGAFIRVGDPLPHGSSRHDFPLAPGELAIWPLTTDGRENRWRFSADAMRRHFANGTARLGRRDPLTGLRPVTYLQPGTLANIANGTFEVLGRTAEGALELGLGERAKAVAPRTVWSRTSHFARDHGSNLIGKLLPGRRFPFPKSLYAVEDSLRFVIADKPDAVVLDFFAGSGTTTHAVMRLNRQDGGSRSSISVTNNEVGMEEQSRLSAEGLRPGDAEWEQWGICDHITKPRIRAAITGKTPDGEAINGDYKFIDEFPMADGLGENVEFFTLTYETPRMVAHNRAFSAIAPLLWLRAGAEGARIDAIAEEGFAVADVYGVLFEVDQSRPFVDQLSARPNARMAFIVTDDDRAFQLVCAGLPEHVEPVRLYESYLTNFTINVGGDR
ncbi:site-specific DNA-methyltransferase [Microbacterium schleiferi]|uniref:site-specific DNA-methyltransferase n=1 Tax=Microbacterium schleiferi TaxID=69362 RepID=UPI001D1792F4|nr:DNA methyltransferase [Microbacterium schleiferi]MCC4267014.1 site-specific DNA-methyltransferase [Microbacterium schleiferi]